MYDLIIIGAGPAGLTAAIYSARANKKVLVLEAKTYGGQIINANKIENYPGIINISGYDYATNLYEQVKLLKVEIKFEEAIKITEPKKVITNKNTYQAKAIIIATGSENKKLNIKNEEKYIGKGISYCATCDGNFYKNKIVAIIGGGNTALEDALYLSNIAKKVYIINRRELLRGEERYKEELSQKNNVEFIYNSNITKLNGNETLESIDIMDNNNNTKNIKINGLFIAIGQVPKNDNFKDLIKVNDYGYIESPDGVHTNIKGIYVAGDTREKHLRQLTTAVADGALSATIAIEEMSK